MDTQDNKHTQCVEFGSVHKGVHSRTSASYNYPDTPSVFTSIFAGVFTHTPPPQIFSFCLFLKNARAIFQYFNLFHFFLFFKFIIATPLILSLLKLQSFQESSWNKRSSVRKWLKYWHLCSWQWCGKHIGYLPLSGLLILARGRKKLFSLSSHSVSCR